MTHVSIINIPRKSAQKDDYHYREAGVTLLVYIMYSQFVISLSFSCSVYSIDINVIEEPNKII